jgi:hypothetical protein
VVVDVSEPTAAPWPPDQSDSPVTNAVPVLLEDKSVNLAQLTAEITAAIGEQAHVSMVGPYEDGKSLLWVLPPSVDTSVVEQVVADHEPEANWGVPKAEQNFQAVMAVLAANPEAELTPLQVQQLAVGLALRSLALAGPPT